MPEYSSTPITPADSVKTPAMNGSTSGNYELSALKAYILASKGLANGLASLDANGKLPTSQLPDLADDVLVYGSYALLPSPGTAGKLYITADDNKMYRWDDALATPAYVELSVDLSDYATKAEVAEAVEDLEAADTDLKNALDSTNARVENLEQEHGSYQEVTAKSPYTIPSGKAKNWAVNVLRGVSRGKNNLVQTSTASDTIGGLSFTMSSDGYFTIGTGTASANGQYGIGWKAVDIGHKYLLVNCFGTRRTSSSYISDLNTRAMESAVVDTTNWNSGDRIYYYGAVLSGSSYNSSKKYYPVLTDLNLYFGGTIPSDADTIAEIQQNYPELLVPSDYGNSLVSTTYEGVKSKGSNRMSLNGLEAFTASNVTFTPTFNSDGELEYLTATGTSNASGNLDLLRYDNFKLPYGTYFLGFGTNNLLSDILVYVNGTWVTINKNGGTITVTDPSQAIWIRGRFGSGVAFGGAKLYPKVNIGSTELPFSPYFTDTLSLPTPITLRSAGSVEETFDLESGEKTNPIARKNLGDSDVSWSWKASGGDNAWSTMYFSSLAKRPASNTDIADILCENGKYTPTYNEATYGGTVIGISLGSGGRLRIYDPNVDENTNIRELLNGTYLDYALATPNAPTQLDPIENPYLPTESGGTISSILTDAVDDNMNLGYLNL